LSEKTQFHIQKLGQLRADRSGFDTQWEEAASLIIPAHRNSFQGRGSDNAFGAQGQKKTELQYDSSVGVAAQRFSSVIESLATPQASVWHRLVPADKMLKRNRAVRLFFDELNEILFSHRYRPMANFVGNSQQTYMGLGTYGNGALYVDKPEDGSRGLRYRNFHLGEVYFVENHAGIVDTFYRSWYMTARQIAQQFDKPGDKLPEAVTEAIKNPQQAEKKFEVLHCVYPRNDFDPRRVDPKGLRYASLYIFVQNQEEIRESGYNSFPLPVARYTQVSGEIYGRGPAQWVLPAIKVLNEQKKTVLKQGHRVVDPVLLAHDDGNLGSFSLKPGALNPGGLNKDGKRMVDVLPTGNIAAGQELMEMEKRVINDVFLVSVFQVLIERRGQTPPTATEVLELAKEKGSLLSPTMGRQQSEDLGPTIEREVDILMAQDKLPELTPAMIEAEADFEVEYESPLSRAQRAEEASGLFRSIEFATAHANVTQDPSAFDWIDIDKAMPAVMEINGVPASWQKSMDDVLALRENRNQQQQVQQMIEAAPAAAGIMKAVGPGL